MIDNQEWLKHQAWELDWHSNCVNSFWEEQKQIVYAKKMGLYPQMVEGKYPTFDLKDKKIVDIGGGPYSLTLKCINFESATVIDPCDYPEWVLKRYEANNITFVKEKGENNLFYSVDEGWMYNCLQHTQNPEAIVKNLKSYAKVVRIFEWIDTPKTMGHPQTLTEKDLNKWLDGEGKVEVLNEAGCRGKAYFGVFKGDRYEKI